MAGRTIPTLTTISYKKRTDSKPNMADDACSVSTNQIASKNAFCDDFANHFYIHCVQPLNSLLSNPFHDNGFAEKERLLVEEAFHQERRAVIGGRGIETVLMEKHLRRKRIAERRKMRERQLAEMRAEAELKARRQFVESKNGGGNSLNADDGTHDSTENKVKSDTVQAESSNTPQTGAKSESRLAVPSLRDASERVHMLLHTAHEHVNKKIKQPMVEVKKVWNSPTKPSMNKKGLHIKPKVFSRQSKSGDGDRGSVDDDTLSLSNPPSDSSYAGNDLIVTEVSAREFPGACVTVDQAQKEDSMPIVASARKALGRDTSKPVLSNSRVDTENGACAVGHHGLPLCPKEILLPSSSYKHQVFDDNNYTVEKRETEKPIDERCYNDKSLTIALSWEMIPSKSTWDESVRPNVHYSNTSNNTQTDQWQLEEELLDHAEDCASTESVNQVNVGFCSGRKNGKAEHAMLTKVEDTRLPEHGAENKETNTDVLAGFAQPKDEDQHPDAKKDYLDIDALARSISEQYSMVMSRRISEEEGTNDRLSSIHDDAAIDAEKQDWVDINERVQCRNMMRGEKGRRHSYKLYGTTDGNSFCSDNTEPTDERLFTANVIGMRNQRDCSPTSYESLTRQCTDCHESLSTSDGDSVGVDSLSCNGKSHSVPDIPPPSVISIPMRAQRSVENSPNGLMDELKRSVQPCRTAFDIHVPSISSESSSNRARDEFGVAMLPCSKIGHSSFSSCFSHDAAKSSETYRLRMNRSMNPSYLTPSTSNGYENTTLNPDVVGNGRQSIMVEPQSHHTPRVTNQKRQYEEKLRVARLRRTQVDDTYYEMKPLAFSSFVSHDVANTTKLNGLSMNHHVNWSRRDDGMSMIDHENGDTLVEESDNNTCNELDCSAISSRLSRDISEANKLHRVMMIRLDGSNAIAAEQPRSLGFARGFDHDDECFPCSENEFNFTGHNTHNASSYIHCKHDHVFGPEGGYHLVAACRKSEKNTLSQHLLDGLGDSGEDFQCVEEYRSNHRKQSDPGKNRFDQHIQHFNEERLCLQRTSRAQWSPSPVEADQDSISKLNKTLSHLNPARAMDGSISTNKPSSDW